LTRLPIDPFVPDIVARVRGARALVVTAPPGAGKTTRLPSAFVADGPVILLQPRRVAARSLARRIAEEQGWTIGREVGWHVRSERVFQTETRLLVATEGILTARLQQDPMLSDFKTVVLDEFHERGIHADLGIALARQAWLAREDLRLVVMSATMETGRVSSYLGGCEVVEIPGRPYALDVTYQPGKPVTAAAAEVASRSQANVLCFLPGAGEIRRAQDELQATVDASVEVVPLYGSLDSAAQDRAISPSSTRRIILATNIAETSLTVPGVTAVVDTGLHKVARYDPDRAVDSLATERISQDSADQRAGRAARIGPGVVWRLWSRSDRLRQHREADIHRIDLSGPLLDVLAWGGDPAAFAWFEAPAADAIAAALALLRQLGAVDGVRLTALGARIQSLPLHPRLSRILIAAGGSRAAALACAWLSERGVISGAFESDVAAAVENERNLPPHVLRVAGELQRLVPRESGSELAAALLRGYPDRVGRRRERHSPRVLLASGHGAVLDGPIAVGEGEYVVALDVQAGRRGHGSEARIRVATAVKQEWLMPTATIVEHELDESGRVRAWERDYYGAIVMAERVVRPDPHRASAAVAAAWLERLPKPDDDRLRRRLQFAGVDVDWPALVEQAAYGCRSVDEVDVARHLPHHIADGLARLAPDALAVPSGRTHRLDYEADGTVSLSVKLQELFGLAETPTVGPRREAVLIKLLAPNGRPVQTTRDLRSFWTNTYPEVRKELRGRYPKHPWPEDPWTARPTARTTRSPRRP
jgi:ATP-dependent RNA helicase HrpB